jgi:hypothetical protein
MPKNDNESAKNECQTCGRAFKTHQGLLGHSQVHRGSSGKRQYRIVGKETGFLHPDGTSKSYPSAEAIRQLIGLHEKGSGRKFSLSREEKEERFANPVEVTAPSKGQVSVRGGVPADEEDGDGGEEQHELVERSQATTGRFANLGPVPVAVPHGLGEPPRGRRPEDDGKRSAPRAAIPEVPFVPKKDSTVTYHGHTLSVRVGEDGAVRVAPPDLFQTYLEPSPQPGKRPENIYASPDGRFSVNGRTYQFDPSGKRAEEVRSSDGGEAGERAGGDRPTGTLFPEGLFEALGFHGSAKKPVAPRPEEE